MSYPTRLLPAANYKKVNFDETEILNRFLVIFTKDKEIIDSTTKRVKADILPEKTERFRDFSTSILGLFEPEDVKWHWQGDNFEYYCYDEWQENSEVSPPTLDQDVYEDHERGHYFWKLSEIHGYTNFINPDLPDAIPFTAKVLHTPMNGNFWHCSLRWYCEGQDSQDMPLKTLRRVMSFARAYLIESMISNIPVHQALNPEDYIQPDQESSQND